jgi:2-hydroxychromene-2-carboxylate isomerase
MQVTCYYDYTCPYSWKAYVWLDRLQGAGADLVVDWRTFSVKEANRDQTRPSAFEGEGAHSVSVLALALAHAAREADFSCYHRGVFEAMHADSRRVQPTDLVEIAVTAGVDVGRLDRVHWLRALAAEHREGAERFGVFGTPTLVLDGEAVVFLKLAQPPEPGEESRLWESLCTLARCHPELLEIKRPTAPSTSVTTGGAAAGAQRPSR